jgi:hypothetical protein
MTPSESSGKSGQLNKKDKMFTPDSTDAGGKPAKPAAKKPAKKRARKKAAKKGDKRSSEKAGVGNAAAPKDVRVPDSVLIPKGDTTPADPGTKVSTTGPEVQGDKTQQIIDVRNGLAVHVSLIEGVALTPEIDGRLVYVQCGPTTDTMTVMMAKKKFAVKKDGTVIYNALGFDDVPGGDFDMLDIVKLVEHNNK